MGSEQGISTILHGTGRVSIISIDANDAGSYYVTCAPFQVHIGVHGYVREAMSGFSLSNVNIMVEGIRHNLTTGKFGEYYRLLLPGAFNITAAAPG